MSVKGTAELGGLLTRIKYGEYDDILEQLCEALLARRKSLSLDRRPFIGVAGATVLNRSQSAFFAAHMNPANPDPRKITGYLGKVSGPLGIEVFFATGEPVSDEALTAKAVHVSEMTGYLFEVIAPVYSIHS